MIPLANFTIRFTAPEGIPVEHLERLDQLLDDCCLMEQVEKNLRLFLRRNLLLRVLDVEVKD